MYRYRYIYALRIHTSWIQVSVKGGGAHSLIAGEAKTKSSWTKASPKGPARLLVH